MKIQIVSDFRLDLGGKIPKHNREADMIAFAGDLAPYAEGQIARLAKQWKDVRHIVFVPGNVEF